MNQDSDIKNQVYQCFLIEASSLLPTLEQDLLSFLEEPTTNKVHSLMRNAHTFKGSAASAEQTTISTVAHHLEDVFKALYNPDIILDEELSGLLWECYECLREAVTAEINQSSQPELAQIEGDFDENAILDRVAIIFAQLQTKLGDFFAREAHLPTSEDLGFDVIASIFAESMQQELQQLAAILATKDSVQIALTLRSEAEFFIGIAESYDLPGMKELAQTVLTALEQNSDRTILIAKLALEDFQKARIAVLAGDRSRGGEPSPALRKLVQKEPSTLSPKLNELVEIIESQLSVPKEVNADTQGNEAEIVSTSVAPEQQPTDIVVFPKQQNLENSSEGQSFAGDAIEQILQTLGSKPEESEEPPKKAFSAEKQDTEPPKSNFSFASTGKDVRVDLAQLESLNYIFGELLINQNQQTSQTQQSQANTTETLKQLEQCQKSLLQMLDWSDKYFSALKTAPRPLDNSPSVFSLANSLPGEKFDVLEMDVYGEMHVLIQSAMETMSQLQEQIEKVDSSVKQSELMLKKQQKLMNEAQENLIQARMLPLGLLLNRFPPIIKQLVTVNHKAADLKLSGTHILIDKSISEKLFDPLLHLLRNAIAHGIESPEARKQQGKPATGRIEIKAYHQGNRTTIKVIDDGEGLNWEAIRQQSIAQQFLSADEAAIASESQLAELLFESGFSTNLNLDDLSGRGIGLDAVRTSIERIQGSIEVNSVAGKGTVFSLHFPLVLMTAEMLVCQSKGIVYALQAESIERVIQPELNQISSQQIVQGYPPQKFLLWGEGVERKKLPIRDLDSLLAYSFSTDTFSTPIPSSTQKAFPLLMIRHQDQLLCLEVEQIITKKELAIKSLHPKPTLSSYIQGYSVLSDSRLVMAIDPLELVSQVWSKFEKATSGKGFSQKSNLDSSFERITIPNSIAISSPLNISAEIEQPRLMANIETSDRLLSPSTSLNSTLALQGKSILIIEDSLTQRRLLTLMLQKAGCSVFQAGDGQEALNQLHQHLEVELVICDIEMPVMNGFEFLYAYYNDSTLSPVDVVMLTSRSSDKHRQMGFKLGAKAYLTKPYSEQELLSLLSDLITQKTLTLTTMNQ